MDLNENTYETFCLLYVDNELSLSERSALENFAQTNTDCKKLLADLGATKLVVPSILFEEKETLYRFDAMEATLPKTFKENLYKKQSLIVKINFGYRSLSALSAIAALLALFIGYQFISNTKSSDTKLAVNPSKNKVTQNANLAMNLAANKSTNEAKNAVINNNSTSNQRNKTSYSNNQLKISNQIVKLNHVDMINHTSSSAVKFDEVADIKQTIGVNNTAETTFAKASAIAANTKEPVTPSTNNDSAPTATESFTDLDTEDQEKTLYIANLEINGDKLRGFTRRVNALFRRNKTDKNK